MKIFLALEILIIVGALLGMLWIYLTMPEDDAERCEGDSK